MTPRRPRSTLFPYTTLFRSHRSLPRQTAGAAPIQFRDRLLAHAVPCGGVCRLRLVPRLVRRVARGGGRRGGGDRKSTRLNSSHANISYAVFCLKKKTHNTTS